MMAIIDYGAGNLTSVKLALEALHVPAEITRDPQKIRTADRVVFPGVGAAGAAMQTLKQLNLLDVIRSVVDRRTPFLGICLGTQIIFEHTEEDGGVEGIGLIPGRVRRFRPVDPRDKVPQMGWNSVHWAAAHPFVEGLDDNSEFYFVHSYYPDPADPAAVLGTTDYAGVTFAAAIVRGNLVATQFHPEKSGRLGLRLLANFCAWDGRTAEGRPDTETPARKGVRPC